MNTYETAKSKGGRPRIGPVINMALRPDQLHAVDALAQARGATRAATIRDLIDSGLDRHRSELHP